MKKLILSLLTIGGCSSTVPAGEALPVWEGEVVQVCEAELCPTPEATAAVFVMKAVWHEADECTRGCTGDDVQKQIIEAGF